MSTLTSRGIATRLHNALCAPVDPGLFTWFRRFFLGKILLVECVDLAAAHDVSYRGLAAVLLVGAGLLLSELKGWSRLGILAVFLVQAAGLVSSFPYTINHAYFELALLLLLSLQDPQDAQDLESKRAPQMLRVAQVGILLVFFQAGIQKLAHGQYVDGQFLTFGALFDDGGMGNRLRAVLGLMQRVCGLEPLPPLPLVRPNWIVGAGVTLPTWTWSTLQVMSIGVLLAELALPAFAVRRSSRVWAVLGLLILEGSILILSGEMSFGFTTIACLLAFFPKAARWTYPLSFLALCAAVVWLGV